MHQVTVFKQTAAKMAALNKRLYGVKVGNYRYAFLLFSHTIPVVMFSQRITGGKLGWSMCMLPYFCCLTTLFLCSYVEKGLVLGQLSGNRFTVTLR